MAVPFRRTSKTVKRKRRTHFKLAMPGMTTCPNCESTMVSHRACPTCGFYKGRSIVKVKEA
ncbi:MAG: 50S ribosomal protein L32 [Culicoidibacterales bacterium]